MEQAGKRDLRIRTSKYRISDKEIRLFVQLLYVALKLGVSLCRENRIQPFEAEARLNKTVYP